MSPDSNARGTRRRILKDGKRKESWFRTQDWGNNTAASYLMSPNLTDSDPNAAFPDTQRSNRRHPGSLPLPDQHSPFALYLNFPLPLRYAQPRRWGRQERQSCSEWPEDNERTSFKACVITSISWVPMNLFLFSVVSTLFSITLSFIVIYLDSFFIVC